MQDEAEKRPDEQPAPPELVEMRRSLTTTLIETGGEIIAAGVGPYTAYKLMQKDKSKEPPPPPPPAKQD